MGTFHAFHTAWVTHLSEALNDGVLPPGYYALPEQHLGRSIADVLALHAAGMPTGGSSASEGGATPPGGQAVATAPPRVRHRITLSPSARARRRTLSVRHVSGHRIVALIEIASPANKDRLAHVEEFTAKVAQSLALGVHVLLSDLFPAGPHDPEGLHGAVWRELGADSETPAAPDQVGGPLTLASYLAGTDVEAYLEHLGPGDPLPDMPLFLQAERYVQVPLESTYRKAFRGLPAVWRDVLETVTNP
ncbi:MAG TPA: DUF4058 family protein [Tepidisphaeraceae bacterium]|nr:DUF4058 family protein [Tepidisphaeraceae bacterium]